MNQVEVCPGVFVAVIEQLPVTALDRAVAYGPGLEAALATAADVATLDEWAPECWWVEQGRDADGTPAHRVSHSPDQRWHPTRHEARRAAADAIRNGRVPA